LNPDGSGSAFIAAGDGGVWCSIMGFADLVFERAWAKSQRDSLMVASFGGKPKMKIGFGGLAPQIPSKLSSGDAVDVLAGKSSPRMALSMKIGRQRCASANLELFGMGKCSVYNKSGMPWTHKGSLWTVNWL
jgi:hypothetical protein